MPELPDLEAIKGFLNARAAGLSIEQVEIRQPLVIREPRPFEFVSFLKGNRFLEAERRGKFLLLKLESRHVLAIHFMLSGRLQWCLPGEKVQARTCLIISLEGGKQLRYLDDKLMGKLYLVEGDELDLIPGWKEMGPDALAEEVTPEVFLGRLRRYRGNIKDILTNSVFLAGIGNAYADEVLFAAGVYPFRRRPSLTPAEAEALYHAMRSVLREAIETISGRMGDNLEVEIRDFLQVHRRGGEPCPRCGHPLSEIQANRRPTTFCRGCQH